eukprot:NODE_2072_length_460_cov_75.206813_g1993_i0.p1 GENE.NODE_2072_length_460_cov_75.206813_g1993_i0~~NODE_2072_length_460_cov_75.206813_g1993_i0.p1  ORF type:complete len:52 (+),score=13.01 NODE_2072_length_460_cov_75.206813_g1993_i0:134-289(+)
MDEVVLISGRFPTAEGESVGACTHAGWETFAPKYGNTPKQRGKLITKKKNG